MTAADPTAEGTPPLSQEARDAIDRELRKYPPDKRQSAVMSALRIAQKERGWLSTETIAQVAEHLGIPEIRAYEVATFYSMYDLKPVGRHKLCICTNLPCALMGAVTTAERLKDTLGIGFGETTADGMFTLKEGECFGACGDAPVVIVNNERMHSKVDPDKVGQFLEDLRKG